MSGGHGSLVKPGTCRLTGPQCSHLQIGEPKNTQCDSYMSRRRLLCPPGDTQWFGKDMYLFILSLLANAAPTGLPYKTPLPSTLPGLSLASFTDR